MADFFNLFNVVMIPISVVIIGLIGFIIRQLALVFIFKPYQKYKTVKAQVIHDLVFYENLCVNPYRMVPVNESGEDQNQDRN